MARMEQPEAGSLDAASLLREDHKKVKKLFEEFESSRDERKKTELVREALHEFSVHARLEEELFYPEIRRYAGLEDIVDEATEEHHVAHMLIGELERMRPGQPHYEAKFMVLAESVRHHIEEEESEILPRIEKSGVDLETLGERMSQRKAELMRGISGGGRGTGWTRRKSAARRSTGVRAGSRRGARRGKKAVKSRR